MKSFNVALSQYGVKEIVGKEDNPMVLKYFDDIGFDGAKLKDETAWCSAFVNWCALQAKQEMSGKLNARSWLGVGEIIEDGCQMIGDVVIFWRVSENDWRGHVGFYVRETEGWIYCLGGNQSNQVKISAYRKSRLLGYRRLNQSGQ